MEVLNMGHFLERGDALYWEKEAKRLMKFFDKMDKWVFFPGATGEVKKRHDHFRKEKKHFRKIFSEE